MKITKTNRIERQKKIDAILDQVAADNSRNLIPSGFAKINYIFDLIEGTFCEKAAEKDYIVVNLLNLIEKELKISFNL